jgi:putative membrane protein
VLNFPFIIRCAAGIAPPGRPAAGVNFMSILFAFLHHLAAFALLSALVVEYVLVKEELSAWSAAKILRADLVFGISAGILLAAGLVRVFYTEKGADYYFHNAAFLAKLSLFVLVGLLSIYPTLKFLRWRPELRAGRVPALDAETRLRLRVVVHAEMTGVALIILCGVLMARGMGSFG